MALCVGVLLVSLGLMLYQAGGILTGGVAGIAFLVHYATGWPLGLLFWLFNLPFYWLAARRMGMALLAKTVIAVTLTSVLAAWGPSMLTFQRVLPSYASVTGGVLLGMGFLVLFRHRSSLGGFGILVLFLQERYGWSAGKVQMAIDSLVVGTAFFVVEPGAVGWSVVTVVVLNLVLTFNYRKDRYTGT